MSVQYSTLPLLIPWRLVQMDEDLVEGVFGVDLSIGFAHELLIGSGDRKFVPAGEWLSLFYDDPGDHGVGSMEREKEQSEKKGNAKEHLPPFVSHRKPARGVLPR